MTTSFWRRWLSSLRRGISAGPVSRARVRRQPLCLEALENRVTPSLTPQMVLDINAIEQASSPSEMVAIGSTAYFAAYDGVHGKELWKSDGTAAGTVLVKDVKPGGANSFPRYLTNVNGTLFFTAGDFDPGFGGVELWKSDGTAAGTVLVKVFNTDIEGSSPRHLTNVNGTLFFTADDGPHGRELWKSDGTEAGTVMVKDVLPGPVPSFPNNLTNVNGTLFFTAGYLFASVEGIELWKSDGTAAGTTLVKDINPGTYSSYPSALTNLNGTLFFSANDGTTGSELWKSNGTAAGTVVVKDIYSGATGSYPSQLMNVNGTLLFGATDGTHGAELWKSDGTAAGTMLVKDINPGGGISYPRNLTNVNGTLFFTSDDGTNGRELWRSDGTAAGTVLVNDIYPGATGSYPFFLTNVNGTLFFVADDGPHWQELWKSDGTAAGTTLVKDILAGGEGYRPGWLTNVNGTLFFVGDDGIHGPEPWKSNGTDAGTAMIKEINTTNGSSSPAWLTNVNDTLYFTANATYFTELWKCDGTTDGTVLVKDTYARLLTNVGETLFFASFLELWKSDGTTAGTTLLRTMDYNNYGNEPSVSNLTSVNGTLFFQGFSVEGGYELWKSDGTVAGTSLVKDIFPGGYGGYGPSIPYSSYPSNLTNVNGTLFFTADDGTSGIELWKSDGTAAGTVLVKDINTGLQSGSFPSSLMNVDGTLYFAAFGGANGFELWKSDGTAAGTVLVKDINPGSASSSPSNLTNVNGTLFFAANNGTNGVELWKSAGTAAGTVLVKDINPGSASSSPSNLTVVNGSLFFTADNGTNGVELWRSDGTAFGTVLVKDMNAGSGSSSPINLTVVNGSLFFTASDGTGIWKLWQCDGTAAGTVVVTDLEASLLTNVNDTLFFSGDDGVHGRELWMLVEDGTSLDVSGFPTTITAGVAGSFPVTVTNADGSINTDYLGTIHFTSSDPQAMLPADYTFTAADQGVHTFTATLKTAGSQSITARDTLVPNLADTQSGITVNPAAASQFTVAGFPSPITAGVAGSFVVTARDPYGNRATSYNGTVRFTSNDSQAVLPGNYTFTAGDAGVRSFNATLKTAGSRSLTATDIADGTINGTQTSIQVNAAAARQFRLDAPASVNANASFNLTVTVLDVYGNVVTGYRGRIRFSSSDSTAKLPKNYTFTAADQGVHTFTGLMLRRRGIRSITVTDTLDSTIIGSVWIDVR